MAVKETLQLRHQLLCSGVRIQSATYDTTRHHVLTYDSAELMPYMLRLFSLRREVKNVKLFDKMNPPPAMPLPSTMDKEQNNASKQAKQPQSVVVVHSLSLEYAHKLDMYVCVYSAQSVPHGTKTKHCNLELAVYNVLFLEPASLKKLVHYPGPMSHSLRCAFYEDSSDQLVLAIHKKQSGQSRNVPGSGPSALLNSASNGNYASSQLFQGQSNDGDEDRDGPLEGKPERVSGSMYNHIDILQISKRHFKRNKSHQGDEKTPEEQQAQDRIMLCIEKSRPSMLHSDLIDRDAYQPDWE
uniref:Uncharacterized protein n=1 Tax=Globisporangium ultimum (strain ATCC 200006 / CBS 805.95 / DAOM BR144) TaxID=431595 RepID=K3X7W6_GLOUD